MGEGPFGQMYSLNLALKSCLNFGDEQLSLFTLSVVEIKCLVKKFPEDYPDWHTIQFFFYLFIKKRILFITFSELTEHHYYYTFKLLLIKTHELRLFFF